MLLFIYGNVVCLCVISGHILLKLLQKKHLLFSDSWGDFENASIHVVAVLCSVCLCDVAVEVR